MRRRRLLPALAVLGLCPALLCGVVSDGAASAAGSTFTVAVLPDTQTWTTTGTGRFADATQYLAARRSSLKLAQVLQTGDLVNWGWLDTAQYDVAAGALQTLHDAGVPYLLTVGNHDTRAVGWDGRPGSRGYGGSAYAQNPQCPSRLGAAQCDTRLLIRHTERFNSVFDAADERATGTPYRARLVDNQYTTFTAGGRRWLVLSLEFCPRTAVVDWAARVVAAHPTDNVIVETHYYLDANGAIGTDNQGYGQHSPQFLWNRVIGRYPNVKMVFSGHTGETAYRQDTGVHGNRVASFMFNEIPGNTSNPLRLVTINGSTGTVSSRIYAPGSGESFPQFDRTVTLSLV